MSNADRDALIEKMHSYGRSVGALYGVTCIERYPGDANIVDPYKVSCDPIEVSKWEPNIIVDNSGLILSALCKGEGGYSGLQYVVIGSGNVSWDTSGVPSPTVGQTQMVNELGRVAASIVFLDGSNNPTASVTNKLEISGTFGSGVAEGADWREWGIVGGNATGTANTGLLFDYSTHSAIPKDTETIISRVRIIF